MQNRREILSEPFKSALILLNIGKDVNFGGLIRTADAFGASEIFIVGRRRFRLTGHTGADNHVIRRHFPDLEQTARYLRGRFFRITGIEITPEAKPVNSHPFRGNTAFMPGNEGNGLVDAHKRFCDDFVYIPQFGSGASLNVNVATGIVMHHFSIWARLSENNRLGEKFRPD